MSHNKAPHVPTDVPATISATKQKLRSSIGDVSGIFEIVRAQVLERIEEIQDLQAQGSSVWPEVNFSDIAANTVSEQSRAAVRKFGCAVIRGTFPREQAQAWDDQLAAYLEDNRFFETYEYRDDGFFTSLAKTRPSIFPIYWSKPQIEARQDDAMAQTRRFMNSFWRHESEGRVWFDPTRDSHYPDRIRRRPPGTNSEGLSPHSDSGALERWLEPAYHQVFRHIYQGEPERYDPWDGAYRPLVEEYDTPRRCSTFRTFQGWTALSDMAPDQGVLHTIPIPEAITYQLLRALLSDIADDDLCGAGPSQTLGIFERYHAELFGGLVPIPAVEPGDTVWWHCDMIHSVGAVADQQGWGNVMYIPASPWCDKNEAYARQCGEAFSEGRSPRDFANEDYEVSWKDRATIADLSQRGRMQLGLDASN